MKRFLLAAVGLLALGMAAPASAADMAVRAPPPPPAPLPVIYDWSGFYVGANGGWGQSRNCVDFNGIVGTVISDGCRERSGGLAGGQFGYRWQAGTWVFGLEGQADWADLTSSRVSVFLPISTSTKTDGIGLLTGQIGWAWNTSLLYVKGGAAVTDNRFSILNLAGVELASASSNRWGGVVGVGWEWGFAPNWSAGIEYDHLFMGNSNNSFSIANPVLAAALNNRISQDVDMVTVRVNYRWSWSGWGKTPVPRY